MPFWKRILAGAAALAVLVVLAAAAHVGLSYVWTGAPATRAGEAAKPVEPSASTEALQNDLVSAVARVRPAVVSIDVAETVVVPGRRMRHPFADDEFFREFFRGFEFEIPERRFERHGLGSGVLISADGYVLTNAHVVSVRESIRVRLADGREFPARLVGADPSTDVALLKIEASGLPAAALGRSEDLRVGEFVFAVGTPFDPTLAQTVTFGIISATGRAGRGIAGIEDFIQTDAAINQGNSGGPLANLRGEVIGINTAIRAVAGGNVGIGFAIPIDLARRVAEDLREHGEFRRGYLGVRMRAVRPDEIEALGLDRVQGAFVIKVEPGSPADAAGIEEGDVIVRFAGRDVEDMRHLQALVAGTRPGETVEVVVARGEARKTLRVEVGTFREASGAIRRLGARVEPVDEDLARELGLDEAGVQVVEVEPGSPAARAELAPGNIILQANRQPVRSASELEAALEGSSTAILFVWDHRGGARWVRIPLD